MIIKSSNNDDFIVTFLLATDGLKHQEDVRQNLSAWTQHQGDALHHATCGQHKAMTQRAQEELDAASWTGCWQTDAEAEREKEVEDENGRFCDSKPPLLQEVWEKEHTASLKAFQVFTLRSAGFLA